MIEYYKTTEPVVGEMTAVVTLPTGFDKAKEKLPVIVFLHGMGERESVERLMKVGMTELFVPDQDYHGLRVITVSPWCPEPFRWGELAAQTMDLIKKAVAEYNGDESRVSITGLSMGGFGTWKMISEYPDYFSAAAPICGGGNVKDAHKITVPVRAFHGSADRTVPLLKSVSMAESVSKTNPNVSLTVYAGVGHGSWNQAYKQSDLVEWLIAQHR